MKAKTIKVNQKTTRKTRNRCSKSFNNCTNSSRCNIIFAIIFIMFIAGIFLTSIFMACINAHWIELSQPLYADNNESVNFSEMNEENEKTTTETISVEGFLENLSEVYKQHAAESTTEMSKFAGNENIEKLEESLLYSNETVDDEVKSKENFETSDNSSTSTTTLPAANPCSITDIIQKECVITCSNIESKGLSAAIIAIINTELRENLECSNDVIILKLKNIKYDNAGLTESWIENLNIDISELSFENSPTLGRIYENAFNSQEFQQMTTLKIDGAGSSVFVFETSKIFNGATNLKTLVITNYGNLFFVTYDVLILLKDTLKELEISKFSNLQNFDLKNLLNNSQLQNIERLNLQQNKFLETTMTGKTFDVIKDSVKSINLANSSVKKLSNETFAGCKKLKYLGLENNLIDSLPGGIFDDLESLENLFLQNNSMRSIPNGLFNVQLETETLSKINLLNNPWHCDSAISYLKIFLTATKAEVLINKCVTPPELSDRDIKELFCRVDFCTILCEDTTEYELSSVLGVFQMQNCEEVNLFLKSHDFDEKTIFSQWLSNLHYKINKLSIMLSKIESIMDGAFNSSTFELLTELTIDHNTQVTFVIDPQGFSGLNSIKVLKIQRSAVLSLLSSYSILASIKSSLQEVSLSHIANPFNPSQIFEKNIMENLKVLRLVGNDFKNIAFSNKTFEGIHESVEEIYMEKSKVTKITPDAFSRFKCLKFVDLSGNDLATLDGRFFGVFSNENLISINLSSSNVKSIGSDTFTGLMNLENLDLSNNSIEAIHAGTFDDLKNLKLLNLQNNQLTSIPDRLFSTLQTSGKLLSINLLNNPWHCDDNILYMKTFLTISQANITINECVTPEEFYGNDIKDLWCVLDSCSVNCHDTYEPSLLKMLEMQPCEQIELHLKSHTFNGNTISERWLSNLPFKIYKLFISSSNIEKIKNDSFNSHVFEDLNTLIITCNFEQTFLIESNGFIGLNSIENLNIEESLTVSLLSGYSILGPIRKTLREVSISNITSAFSSNQIFEKVELEMIQILRLIGNNFNSFTFTTLTFAGVHKSLEEIYLQNSGISRITENAFSMFQNLKLINLEGNGLVTLAPTFFGDYSRNENFKIFISNNPWNCSCNIKFLLNFIKDENVLCKTPADLAGQEISVLNEICFEETTMTEEKTTTTSTVTSTSTTSTSKATTTTTTTVSRIPDTTAEIHTTIEQTTPTVTSEETTISTTPIITTHEYNETTEGDGATGSKTTNPGKTTQNMQTTPNQITLTCSDPSQSDSSTPFALQMNQKMNFMPFSSYKQPVVFDRPNIEIAFRQTESNEEVIVELSDVNEYTILLYYPNDENPFVPDSRNDDRFTIKCMYVSTRTILVINLAPDVIYNFCTLRGDNGPYFESPFQCKSFLATSSQPWIYEGQKTIILTSLSLIIFMTLVIGIALTYFLIRQFPTLIKGSKRVVLVNNRSKEVMILPRNSCQSISSSCRKQSLPHISNEPPTYLTPLPRQSIDNRPPLVRSSSDTSLKSYVSVSRLPPRFSQVYQRDDFDNAIRHNGSFPCCAPSATCLPSSEIPPPLPRRSIVSTGSSTQHSCASTVELGRTMSRTGNHNSTYRRHPRPIEVEQENLYNVII